MAHEAQKQGQDEGKWKEGLYRVASNFAALAERLEAAEADLKRVGLWPREWTTKQPSNKLSEP